MWAGHPRIGIKRRESVLMWQGLRGEYAKNFQLRRDGLRKAKGVDRDYDQAARRGNDDMSDMNCMGKSAYTLF